LKLPIIDADEVDVRFDARERLARGKAVIEIPRLDLRERIAAECLAQMLMGPADDAVGSSFGAKRGGNAQTRRSRRAHQRDPGPYASRLRDFGHSIPPDICIRRAKGGKSRRSRFANPRLPRLIKFVGRWPYHGALCLFQSKH